MGINQDDTMIASILSVESNSNLKQQRARALPLYMLLSMDDKVVIKECSYASNPYHKCTPRCIQRMNGEEAPDMTEIKDTSISTPSRQSKESSYMKSPKSPRAVPLNMFVSPNGRNLQPKCPNASNPYHKCTERCIERINEGQTMSERDPSDIESNKSSPLRSSEATKKKNPPTGIMSIFSPDIRKVSPKCPNANNPFHKCSKACIQKRNAAANQSDGETLAAIGKKGDNSYAKRPKSPLRIPLSMFTSSNKQNVNPKCPYESNPYHKCNPRCIDRMHAGNKQSKEERLDMNNSMVSILNFPEDESKSDESLLSASTPSRKVMNSPKRRNVPPRCPNASHLFHMRTETCLQEHAAKEEQNESKTPVSEVIVASKEEKTEEDIDAFTPCLENFYVISPESKEKEAEQVDASNPRQEFTEGKMQSDAKREVETENNEEMKAEEGKTDVSPKQLGASDSNKNPTKKFSCENDGTVGKEEMSNEHVKGVDDSNSGGIRKVIEVEEKAPSQPTCIDGSTELKNYDINCFIDENEGAIMKRSEIVATAERSIDGCFKTFTKVDVVKEDDPVELAKERKEDGRIAKEKYEDFQCKNVYKPNHKCNEHCFSRIPEKKRTAKDEKSKVAPSSLLSFCSFRINSRKSS